MKKIDFKKELKELYNPPRGKITVVDVPAMNFIMIDGQGDPAHAESYQQAIEALYGVSYTLKFMVKKGDMEIDYGVPPLEGLWWTNVTGPEAQLNRAAWQWTSMIMAPDFVSHQMFDKAREQVHRKKAPPALGLLRFESFQEGKAAQIVHFGPYSEEGPTIEKLHQFLAENGWKLRDKHHEIYLGDPRKTAPEKLKTIIRQPFS